MTDQDGNGLPPQDAPPPQDQGLPPEPPPQDTPPPVDGEPPVDDDLSGLSPEEIIERAVHKTQSWQGRQNKELLTEVARMNNETLAEMKGMVGGPGQMGTQYAPPQQRPRPQMPDLDPMSDEFPQQIENFLNAHEIKRGRERAEHQSQADGYYEQALTQVRHSDPKIHEAVMKEINNVQNVDPMSGLQIGPFADARVNYATALQTVLTKQLGYGPTENPLKDNPPPKPGMGVSQPSATASGPSASMPKMDAETQKLAAYLVNNEGWGNDKLKKTLQGG